MVPRCYGNKPKCKMAKILQLRKQNVVNVKNTAKKKMYLKNKTDSFRSETKCNVVNSAGQKPTAAY